MSSTSYRPVSTHDEHGSPVPGFAGVGAGGGGFHQPQQSPPQGQPSPHPSMYGEPPSSPYEQSAYLEPAHVAPAPYAAPQGARTPSMYSPEPSPAPGFNPYHNQQAQQSYYDEPRVMPPAAPVAEPVATYEPSEKTPYLRAYERRRRRAWCFFLTLLAIIAIALAVVLPVYFVVIKPRNNSSNGSSKPDSPKPTGPATGDGTTGGQTGTDPDGNTFIIGIDGTTVKTAQGNSFVYRNPFGGYFIQDTKNPYNSGARANSWTPPLNESWRWGTDKVRGVNLGGWLVPEPFIAPALYQKYLSTGTITGDEWTLSEAMAADPASGGLGQMEDHYKTFITEEDFAQIAGAGLNYVRLPIPFWAVETWPGEPFLERTSWTYILQAFEWARKYGLRINLDIHTMPGAQNLWNHSGRGGQINFLNGVMGYANVQRGLGYIRYITEFISQPQYSNVVTMFGIVNEPTADVDALRNFYLEAHDVIRSITGFGEGKGPFISIHDQFLGPGRWAGFAAGADRMALEQHPYFAFGAGNAPDITPFIARPCTQWGPGLLASQNGFGVTTSGEWSLGFNDCGYLINGIGDSHATTDCEPWDDWQNYDDTRKAQLKQFAMAQMDAMPHWFFWTWKIGADQSGTVRAPLWSYSLGLQNGWIPTDPREAEGTCQTLGQPLPAAGAYEPWQTGGAGAGTLQGAGPVWPPTSIPGLDVATGWPSYTASAPVITMPGLGAGADGWFNDNDNAPGITTIAGCTYPDEYRPGDVLPPACPAATDAAPVRARAPAPLITPPPSATI
ncbi:glycoside hydrolase [Auricularia subglabra TFB-10046 SS5]|nr:glycoside hydrolase [Auricularia subglabra TFB-10046 SS5]